MFSDYNKLDIKNIPESDRDHNAHLGTLIDMIVHCILDLINPQK